MAGAVKHMERSHRSYGQHYGIFNNFNRKAYAIKSTKEQKESLGQRFAQLFNRMKGDK